MEAGPGTEGWESREALLAAAPAAGHQLTGTRLSRLHRAGLISRPKTRSLGRGQGRQSLYPPGTRERLLRVLEVQCEVRSFAEIAWRLWWEDGGCILPAVRVRLRRVASEVEAHREKLAALLAGEDTGDSEAEAEMESLYRSMEGDRIPPSLGWMRGNVGRAGFASVIRVLAEVCSGRFAGYEEVGGEGETGREELVEQALGIDRARADRLDGCEPWFEGSSEDDMRKLSALASDRSFAELADADEAELGAAREELRPFIDTIRAVTSALSGPFGPVAFGFGTVSAMFRDWRAEDQAFLLLAWLALRSDEQLRQGMLAHGALQAEAAALETLYESMVEWREEMPAYAKAFADESLAAALQNPEAQAQLSEELKRLYRDYKPEVDRFLDCRPELRHAMAVFE